MSVANRTGRSNHSVTQYWHLCTTCMLQRMKIERERVDFAPGGTVRDSQAVDRQRKEGQWRHRYIAPCTCECHILLYMPYLHLIVWNVKKYVAFGCNPQHAPYATCRSSHATQLTVSSVPIPPPNFCLPSAVTNVQLLGLFGLLTGW